MSIVHTIFYNSTKSSFIMKIKSLELGTTQFVLDCTQSLQGKLLDPYTFMYRAKSFHALVWFKVQFIDSKLTIPLLNSFNCKTDMKNEQKEFD